MRLRALLWLAVIFNIAAFLFFLSRIVDGPLASTFVTPQDIFFPDASESFRNEPFIRAERVCVDLPPSHRRPEGGEKCYGLLGSPDPRKFEQDQAQLGRGCATGDRFCGAGIFSGPQDKYQFAMSIETCVQGGSSKAACEAQCTLVKDACYEFAIGTFKPKGTQQEAANQFLILCTKGGGASYSQCLQTCIDNKLCQPSAACNDPASALSPGCLQAAGEYRNLFDYCQGTSGEPLCEDVFGGYAGDPVGGCVQNPQGEGCAEVFGEGGNPLTYCLTNYGDGICQGYDPVVYCQGPTGLTASCLNAIGEGTYDPLPGTVGGFIKETYAASLANTICQQRSDLCADKNALTLQISVLLEQQICSQDPSACTGGQVNVGRLGELFDAIEPADFFAALCAGNNPLCGLDTNLVLQDFCLSNPGMCGAAGNLNQQIAGLYAGRVRDAICGLVPCADANKLTRDVSQILTEILCTQSGLCAGGPVSDADLLRALDQINPSDFFAVLCNRDTAFCGLNDQQKTDILKRFCSNSPTLCEPSEFVGPQLPPKTPGGSSPELPPQVSPINSIEAPTFYAFSCGPTGDLVNSMSTAEISNCLKTNGFCYQDLGKPDRTCIYNSWDAVMDALKGIGVTGTAQLKREIFANSPFTDAPAPNVPAGFGAEDAFYNKLDRRGTFTCFRAGTGTNVDSYYGLVSSCLGATAGRSNYACFYNSQGRATFCHNNRDEWNLWLKGQDRSSFIP